jgi:hypothetical protein
MKKLITLCLAIILFSCNIESDEPNFNLEVMAIESVDVPLQFNFGQTHQISVTYTRPNGCYEFNDFIFQPNGNTRTIAVVDTVYFMENCTEATEEATVSFDFLVLNNETYVFQFYQGEDDNGEDQYLIVEVPVVN